MQYNSQKNTKQVGRPGQPNVIYGYIYVIYGYIWMASYKNKCGNKLVSSIHTSFPYNTSEYRLYSRRPLGTAAHGHWPDKSLYVSASTPTGSSTHSHPVSRYPLHNMQPCIPECSRLSRYSVPDARHCYLLIINASQAIRAQTSLQAKAFMAKS